MFSDFIGSGSSLPEPMKTDIKDFERFDGMACAWYEEIAKDKGI